jgi:hypothetical protein
MLRTRYFCVSSVDNESFKPFPHISTQLATTDSNELVVRGFDDPTKCAADGTDYALVESWSLVGM